ncbi:DUF1643 domain-containing protein [Rossellomorea sp. DUT-2]|uniref:DUF1643 domain-containing protein n=1 Tax=Rossellomorea sp. DUT-2 TaxID=3412021 RepID=UPI003D16A258
MKVLLNTIIDLKNSSNPESFQEEFKNWIERNNWEVNNADSVILPDINIDKIRLGTGTSIFHTDYVGECSNNEAKKRYFLSRTWDARLPTITTFMMNPSSADELTGDNTVNFMIDYAKHNGYGTLFVVNTSPVIKGSNTNDGDFLLDDDCFSYIEHALTHSEAIVLGWGENGQKYGLPKITKEYPLIELLQTNQHKLKVFGYGKENTRQIYPKHPHPQKVSQRFSIQHDLIHVTKEKRNELFGSLII